MKILISGHTGQVARELQLALSKHELVRDRKSVV